MREKTELPVARERTMKAPARKAAFAACIGIAASIIPSQWARPSRPYARRNHRRYAPPQIDSNTFFDARAGANHQLHVQTNVMTKNSQGLSRSTALSVTAVSAPLRARIPSTRVSPVPACRRGKNWYAIARGTLIAGAPHTPWKDIGQTSSVGPSPRNERAI